MIFDDINTLCIYYNIYNYKINSNGIVDVDGDVCFLFTNLNIIPINFGIISGNFTVDLCGLYTITNMPKYIAGHCSLFGNNIIDLFGLTTDIGGTINLGMNPLDININNLDILCRTKRKIIADQEFHEEYIKYEKRKRRIDTINNLLI